MPIVSIGVMIPRYVQGAQNVGVDGELYKDHHMVVGGACVQMNTKVASFNMSLVGLEE